MDGFEIDVGDHTFASCSLCFYLRSSVKIEHQTLLLGDDAPHLLPRFVLLTVLQEATHDAAACELSCLDLHGGRKPQISQSSLYLEKSLHVYVFTYVWTHPLHLQDALLLALGYPFSSQDGETVFADFVHFVAIIFKRNLIVWTFPAHHLQERGREDLCHSHSSFHNIPQFSGFEHHLVYYDYSGTILHQFFII